MRSASARRGSASVTSVIRRPMRASAAAYWPRSRPSCSLPSMRSTAEGSERWCGLSASGSATRSNTRTNLRAGAGGNSTSFVDGSGAGGAIDRGSCISGPADSSTGSDFSTSSSGAETTGGDAGGGVTDGAPRLGLERRCGSGSGASAGGRVARIRGQSNSTPGCWSSSARIAVSSNAARPTFTCGGVLNQYKRAGRSLSLRRRLE